MADPTPPQSSTPSAHRETLVPFGVELLDAQTGGIIRERLYLLHGPHGALKTSFALSFVQEGLKTDQKCVYVTSQDPDALLLQADRLGFDFRPYIREDRLTILTYLPRLSQQIALISDYSRVMSELTALTGAAPLDRVVIDPLELLISPENRTAYASSARLLLEALKGLGSTLLTLIDDSLEPLVQALLKEVSFLAFGVFQVEQSSDLSHVLRLHKVIWNPTEHPSIPLALRSHQGVQGIEKLEASAAARSTSDGAADLPEAQDSTGSGHSSRQLPGMDPLSSGRALQLLLIDDDEIYREMLQEFLRDRYKVEMVFDPVEAVLRLGQTPFDAVMVNLNMPRVDGREVCLKIRDTHGAIPLVAYSNKLKRGADIASILRIGADSFISRPLAFNQVKATLESVLRRPASATNFSRSRELIREILDESAALKTMQDIDPETGLNPGAFFERKLRKEIEKARIGDYSFAVVGYSIRSKHVGEDIEPRITAIWRPLLRSADMVLRYAPGYYVVYLEECLAPGVKRFNERLRKALGDALGPNVCDVRYETAIFPVDGKSYDELIELALRPLRETTHERSW